MFRSINIWSNYVSNKGSISKKNSNFNMSMKEKSVSSAIILREDCLTVYLTEDQLVQGEDKYLYIMRPQIQSNALLYLLNIQISGIETSDL